MKGFLLLLLLLLLSCLTIGEAAAQSALAAAPDYAALQPLAQRVFLPAFALCLLSYFVLTAIKLVLNHLLKQQIVAAATSERVVERLLPGPQDEQNKVVKGVALLLSTSGGLLLCNQYLPLGIHSVIILLFSTALGFLAYLFFLRRQAK